MKKYTIIRFLALMVLALPLSCVREVASEDPVKPQGDGEMITIRATLEQGLTKTYLDASYAVVWNAGDQILVLNASNPNGEVFTLEETSAGSTQGSFTGNALSGGGPFYAVYPASAANVPLTGGTVSLAIPGAQVFTAPGTFAQGANIAVGVAAAMDEIHFKNVCGLLELPIEGDASISGITITSDNGEPLSGTVQAVVSPSAAPSISWEEGASSLSLTFPTPEALAGGKTFYLVVPAGSFAQGFSVEIQDAAGGAMFRHASSDGSNVIERSTIRPMPAITYVAECSSSWLSTSQPGVYSGITPGNELQRKLLWQATSGQYAWMKGNGTTAFRIQDWTAGYSLQIAFPSDQLVLGKSYDASIKAMGETAGIASAEVSMKLMKKAAGNYWLSDGTYGYIMKTEED